MKPVHCIVLLCLSQSGSAVAEIYKSVDAEGHVTYSSTPSKGSKKLGLEQTPSAPAAPRNSDSAPVRPRSTSTPPDFPKVDSSTQKSRDNTRQKILADELDAEEKLLAEARQNLKAGEVNPEYDRDQYHRPVLSGRYKDKIGALQAEVTLHEKNIAALKSELSNLK